MSGNGVDFLLDGDVEPEALRAALAQALSVDPDQVDMIADLSDIRDAPVIAQVGELDGGFPMSVAVYVRREIGLEFVQAVSRALGMRALVSDDSPNPFTWLLAHPDGSLDHVEVDPEALDREEFEIVRVRKA